MAEARRRCARQAWVMRGAGKSTRTILAFLFFAACARAWGLVAPVSEDWVRGGQSSIEGWMFASNNCGRITINGGAMVDDFDVGGALIVNAGTYFRGNTYQADTNTTLIGHEFYLSNSTPAAVTFLVYESIYTNGPFSRVDSATVYAPAGVGFLSSGRREVPLRRGFFYAVGVAVQEESAYQSTSVSLPRDVGPLTALKGLQGQSIPGDNEVSFGAISTPYRQRLLVSSPSDSAPDANATVTSSVSSGYLRANLYAPSQTTWLLGHGFEVGRTAAIDVNLFVYESTTRTGTFSRLDLQTVSTPAATNYVAVPTRVQLVAGRYYLIGAQWTNNAVAFYSSGRFASTPTTFSWGQAIEGLVASSSGAPPATLYKNPSSTNYNAYCAHLAVGDLPALRMDASASIQMSTNRATVAVTATGYTDLTLAFDHRESGDEAHADDGVFLSANGTTFTRVMNLDTSSTAWTHYETNLIALADTAGLSTSGSLYVRFQQMDDYPWPSDGREFANIRIFAEPDLSWQEIAMTGSNYLFRGHTTKTFGLKGSVLFAGGADAVTDRAITVRHRLYDEIGTLQNAYTSFTVAGPAMGHTLADFSSSFSVSASTPLTQCFYRVAVSLDSGNALAEGREDNNTRYPGFIANHYSGILRFGGAETSATLTDWDFQPGYGAPTYSPVYHVVSGTGSIDGHAFAFTNLMVRKDTATGDYAIDPNETQQITVAGLSGSTGTVSGVRCVFDNDLTLSTAGAKARCYVMLPSGCGFVDSPEEPWGAGIVGPVILSFDGDLNALGSVVLPHPSGWFFEESKPLFFQVSGLAWQAESGSFVLPISAVCYAHAGALDALHALVTNGTIAADQEIRRSNDGYYRTVLPDSPLLQVTLDPVGAAQASFSVAIDQGDFRSHMPYDTKIAWGKKSYLSITNDVPDVSPGVSALGQGQDFSVSYGAGCPGGCQGAGQTNLLSCENTQETFYFTRDGGLYAPCAFSDGTADITWGYLPSMTAGQFAQQAYGFSSGVFHMPGHFLRTTDCPAALASQDTPGALVLSAVGNSGDDLTRPLTDDYTDGVGNYAGVTLSYESDTCEGVTILGGKVQVGPYTLDPSCKLYVRSSGVSGIHSAAASLGSVSVELYGYPFTFDHLALSYLSTENKDSRTDGRLAVPSPCGFTLEFKDMHLSCMGDLASAVPSGKSDQLDLAYWSASIRPANMLFVAKDECTPGDRTLAMDVATQVDNIKGTLFGRLGFLPTGNLAASSDATAAGDSRLSLPATFQVPGPGDRSYTLRAVTKGYFNDYRNRGDLSATGDGLFTFFAELDVPFFENLLVQGFTSPDTTGATSPVYFAGGWPTKGWRTSGATPFDPAATFDSANAAHPTGAGAPSFTDYLAGARTDYIPRARREWIAGLGFDIGVRWDAATRSFRSPDPHTSDLLVLQTEYNVPQLTPDRAEITFGLQYGELPALNLSSVFFNAVDEATGISERFKSVVGEAVNDALDQGVAALDTVTATDPTDLLSNTLADQIDPFVDHFYTSLSNAYATGNASASSISNLVDHYVRGGAGAPTENFRFIVGHIVDGAPGVGSGLGLVDDLNDRIDQAVAMIDALTDGVDTGDPIQGTADGLLSMAGDSYPIIEELGRVLLIFAVPAMQDGDTALNEQLALALETVGPSLAAVRESLLDVRDQLDDVRESLDVAGDFHMELSVALDTTALDGLADSVADRIDSELEGLNGPFNPCENYTADEIKARLRSAIVDGLREASPIAQLQRIVRARMLDIDRQIRSGVDSALGQINTVMRDSLSQMLGSLDNSITQMTGDFADVLGTGQVEGYAHISGDSLDKLHVDLAMQMKVPDNMNFSGFLEIVNEQTVASGGCAFPDGSTYKITLGANDVACDWLGSDLRINCNCFFTLNDGIPKGMGGGIELVGGTLTFEAVEVQRFGAAVAFGALENYLAASTRVSVNGSVDLEGGIFFGRTCSLTPLLVVDDEVDKVLGQPPFTGAYLYGEGWIPIVDYGCVFRIKAGTGLGVFYFVEGPTYGVHVLLGASGEALCVVDVRGEIELYGVKQGQSYRARGKGKIKGKAGCCPFCVKFNKTVTVTYDDGEWDADY